MEDFFKYTTPIIYWLLIVLWMFIFIFYSRKIGAISTTDKLLRLLLLVLALDAFRTLFESIYFGAWYTSLSGLIPIDVFTFLAKPQIVFFPKMVNLITAGLILTILIRKWLSSEIKQKNAVNDLIQKQVSELKETNKILTAAKEKAEESENRFAALTNQSIEGITVADMEGNYVFVNPAFCIMSGYQEAELLKMTVFDMKATSHSNKSFLDSKTLDGMPIEFKLKRKDKIEYFTEITGKIIKSNNQNFVLGTIRDISERKQAELNALESQAKLSKALEESNKSRQLLLSVLEDQLKAKETLRETNDYLESLFNFTTAPIVVWDPSLKITRFNRAFEQLSGFDVAEVIGQQVSILFPEDKVQYSLSLINKTTEGEKWDSVEIKILRKDKKTKIVVWNSSNIFDNAGKTIVATIALGYDITERKHAEDEIQEQLEELRRWYEVTLNREGRIMQLKQEVNELLKQSGKPLRYGNKISDYPEVE